MTLAEFSLKVAPTIQAAASVLALLSILLLWYQIWRTNKWNRVAAAFQLMELDRFEELEATAVKACKAIDVKFPTVLSRDDALKVRSDYNAYHAVKALMTFLDRICVAHQSGYADHDVVAVTYGPLIVGYHKYMQAYVALAREEMEAPESYRHFALTASQAGRWLDTRRKKIRAHEQHADRQAGKLNKL